MEGPFRPSIGLAKGGWILERHEFELPTSVTRSDVREVVIFVDDQRVVGSSDDKGAEPASNPKTPQDVLATLYRHLGIDTTVQYADHSGRPHPVLPSGNPIGELFS